MRQRKLQDLGLCDYSTRRRVLPHAKCENQDQWWQPCWYHQQQLVELLRRPHRRPRTRPRATVASTRQEQDQAAPAPALRGQRSPQEQEPGRTGAHGQRSPQDKTNKHRGRNGPSARRSTSRARDGRLHPQRPGRHGRVRGRRLIPSPTPSRFDTRVRLLSPLFRRAYASCVSPRRNVPNRATWMFSPKTAT